MVPHGKWGGVMLLCELRNRIGNEKFDAAMDLFGRGDAGKAVNSQEFISAMTTAYGSDLKDFFAKWLDGTDALPTLELQSVLTTEKDGKHVVSGQDFVPGWLHANQGCRDD